MNRYTFLGIAIAFIAPFQVHSQGFILEKDFPTNAPENTQQSSDIDLGYTFKPEIVWKLIQANLFSINESKNNWAKDYAEIVKDYPDLQSSNKELQAQALKKAIARFDDDSVQFSLPQTNKAKLAGIGVGIEKVGKTFKITTIVSNSPAEKAGIKSEDEIIEIDGRKINNFTRNEVFDALKGDIDTVLKIGIRRGAKNRIFSIKRKMIFLYEIDVRTENNVGIIKLTQFGTTTEAQFAEILHSVAKKNVDGILIDLQDNIGGFLDATKVTLSPFVSGGKLIGRMIALHSSIDIRTEDKNSLLDPSIPIGIVVNKNTYGNGEILSDFLQMERRAIIFGEKTHGFDTVTSSWLLPEKYNLEINSGIWETSKGLSLKNGVQPDVILSSLTKEARVSEAIRILKEMRNKKQINPVQAQSPTVLLARSGKFYQVKSIIKGSHAEKSGLQLGDILHAVNGTAVQKKILSRDGLASIIAKTPKNEMVNLDIVRKEKGNLSISIEGEGEIVTPSTKIESTTNTPRSTKVDPLIFNQPKSALLVLNEMSPVTDICEKKTETAMLYFDEDSGKNIREILKYDIETKELLGVSKSQDGKTWVGPATKRSYYTRWLLRPYAPDDKNTSDFSNRHRIGILKRCDGSPSTLSYYLTPAAITDVLSAGPATSHTAPGLDLTIGSFTFKSTISDPTLTTRLKSVKLQLMASSNLTITNIRMQMVKDGQKYSVPCLFNDPPNLICSPSELMDEVKPEATYTILADITKKKPGKSTVQLQISEFGTPFKAGAVSWSNDSESFTWMSPPNDTVTSTKVEIEP